MKTFSAKASVLRHPHGITMFGETRHCPHAHTHPQLLGELATDPAHSIFGDYGCVESLEAWLFPGSPGESIQKAKVSTIISTIHQKKEWWHRITLLVLGILASYIHKVTARPALPYPFYRWGNGHIEKGGTYSRSQVRYLWMSGCKSVFADANNQIFYYPTWPFIYTTRTARTVSD